MKVDSRWFKGIPTTEKEKRKEELARYKLAFEDLSTILEKEIKVEEADYDCPSWSHKQADRNGYNRALRMVLKLIDFKEG